jgi:hypothetical protein
MCFLRTNPNVDEYHRSYHSKFSEDSFTRSCSIKLQGTSQLRPKNQCQQQFLTIMMILAHSSTSTDAPHCPSVPHQASNWISIIGHPISPSLCSSSLERQVYRQVYRYHNMPAASTIAHLSHHSVSDDERPPLPKPLTRDTTKGGRTIIRPPAFLGAPPMDRDTPSDFIPGLYTLGSTYDVLNGKYADPKSTIQEVIDWNKCEYTLATICGLPADIQLQPMFASRSSVEKTTASPK